jgi:NAD(P)H dehydrogenase (quinone)
MQAHIVLAHPEPRSFNAHLAELARRTLEAKGWQVTVSDLYAMGFDPLEGPHASRKWFEVGRFAGKRAMLSVTVGTSAETYAHDGRSGDIALLLWPVNFSLAYVGYEVLAPFVAYGVEAGLRYSDPGVVEARLRRIEEDWTRALDVIEERATIPFNRMADWGPDGRITPGAPVHSPFVRRKAKLELE